MKRILPFLLSTPFFFNLPASAENAPAGKNQEKEFRVGMSWVVKDEGAMLTFDRYEVTKVEGGKVTWRKTTLNKEKKPFAGDKGTEFTFPILKVKDLLAGKEEEIQAAGRTFRCRRIESPAGTVWRSLEYPILSVREQLGDTKRELVEFKP